MKAQRLIWILRDLTTGRPGFFTAKTGIAKRRKENEDNLMNDEQVGATGKSLRTTSNSGEK